MLKQLVKEVNGALRRKRTARGRPLEHGRGPTEHRALSDVRLVQAYEAYYGGDLTRARELCDELVAVEPEDPEIRYLDAELNAQAGDVAAALTSYSAAIRGKPDFVEAYVNAGLLLRDSGKLDEAAHAFRRGSELEPENGSIFNNLATVFILQKRYGLAQQHLRRALELAPQLAEAHCNLGVVAQETGNRELAEASFRTACELKPDYVDAYSNFGLALRQWERYEEAEHYLRRAIELQPNSVLAHCNLGYVMLDLARPETAFECFQHVIDMKPDNVEAIVSCGLARRDQGELDAAVEYFERALALQPDYPEARLNRAYYRLLLGDLKQGWEDYEYRLRTNEAHRRLSRTPRWDGEPLARKRVLVFGEQGLGDEVLFASCLPDVLRDASTCTLECDARLVNLFQRSFPEALVREKPKRSGDESNLADSLDVRVPIGSLPRLYRDSFSKFPQHKGYLKADPEKVDRWRRRLASLGGGLKVGISWRGGLGRTRGLRRSTSLAEWRPLLQLGGMRFISLQYTDCEDELTTVQCEQGVPVRHWQEAIDDYDETAALLSALDVVVSVCTSVVSLGGALGCPVWVLVPSSPGWMFLREGERMPWFPSLRLFRQSRPNDWGPVLQRVAEALQKVSQGEGEV